MKKTIKNFLRKHDGLEFFVKVLYFRAQNVLAKIISDEAYIRVQYRLRTGLKLNLDAPKLYNEKIQWLKLNYKNPLLNQCIDKWDVREYVERKGLGHLLIPAYGPFDSVDEIDKGTLPDAFILKLTNGSSFNIICKDKSEFDFSAANKKFDKWKGIDFFSARREWAYKNVKNRVMCEDLLQMPSGGLPSDIRFFCFDGEPQVIAIDLDSVVGTVKTSNYYRHLFTSSWEPIDAKIEYPEKPEFEPERPDNLEELLEVARTLSKDFPAVRVDLYNIGSKIYFGELTFYHASGYQNIQPLSFHKRLGSYMTLPNTDKCND